MREQDEQGEDPLLASRARQRGNMEFNATFLVSIISFLVFMKIMNAIFYAPLTQIIDERENIVHDNYEHSRHARHEAEKIAKDKALRLDQTAKESRQILIDKTNEANSDYKKIVTDAKTKSNEKVEVLKNELAKSEDEAKNILNSHVEDLAQSIVSKVLGGNLNG